MKKLLKNISAAVLIMALCLTMLSGCSKEGDKESNTTPTPQPTDTATDPATDLATDPGSDGDEVDGGKEASSLPDSLDNPNLTILWHTSEETYLSSKQEDPNTFDAVWNVKSAFEEKYGGKVTVETVDWGGQKEQLIGKVNASEVVDLAQANDQNFPIYPTKNIVQDISAYVDVKDEFWNQGVTNAYSFAGTPYAVGVNATPVVLYYNKTLFDNYGEKTPREYSDAGEWTWDTFRTVALAMTADTDGDSVNDTFGFGWWDSVYVQFLASNGITHIAYNDDGSITSNYGTKQAEEAMTFLQNAYVKDKYIDVTQDGDYFMSMFMSGKLAMTCEYGLNGYNVYACDYEIDWAPFPTGPSGAANQGGGELSGWCIPVTAQNGEGAAAFMRMSAEMQLQHNSLSDIDKYGEADVDKMNVLADYIVFAPIGIEKYWDANWTIREGLMQGTPVSTFLTTAEEQLREGAAITLEQ